MRLPLWVVPVAKLVVTALVVAGIYVGRLVFEPVVLPDVNPAVSVRTHCPPPEAQGLLFLVRHLRRTDGGLRRVGLPARACRRAVALVWSVARIRDAPSHR